MMNAKSYMLPPIRADTAHGYREPQLMKKWLKRENLDSRRNDGKLVLEE